MRARPLLLALLLVLIVAAAAIAHDTWLMPDRFAVAPGDTLRLDMTSGDSFPGLDAAIDPARVRRSGVRLAGRTIALARGDTEAHSLVMPVVLRSPGVATLFVELAPRQLELRPELITEYLDDIAASRANRARWAARPAGTRWRERYVKHAKTFVRVGEPAGDRSWALAVGIGLEIIPERDPTQLRTADSLPVHVLSHGRPLAGLAVGLDRVGQANVMVGHTDAAGRTVLRLGAPGRWLVHATDLRPSLAPSLEWESDFTTLTLAVRP